MGSRQYINNLRNTRSRRWKANGNADTSKERICEICGKEMERDPESGEFYCAECYYSEYNA